MADSISTTNAETQAPVGTAQAFATDHEIPLEQRTDVTVDELERLSLPFTAQLYDGKVVFKMANFAHGLIQNNIGTALGSYLKTNPIGLVSDDANYRLWPERKKNRARRTCRSF